MVEGQDIPAARGVTVGTFLAERSRVSVIEKMAGLAVRRGPLVALTRVTSLTFDGLVLAYEGELGVVVVESGPLPVLWGVTFRAVPSQASAMGLVVAVALDAVRGSLAMLLLGRMAALTENGAMPPFEREIGLRMLERLGIELHDVRVPPEMLAVADSAVATADLGRATVKADLPLHVLRDLLMTVQTEALLLGLAEALMAFFAVFLDLRMALDHGAWHDEALEGPRGGSHGKADAHPKSDRGPAAQKPSGLSTYGPQRHGTPPRERAER